MAYYIKGNSVANAKKYELFKKANGVYTSLAEASEINFEVSALGLASGSHVLVVKAKADGYEDSEYSNEVTYTVEGSDSGEDTGGDVTNPTLTLHKTADDAGMSIFYYQNALRTNSNGTFKSIGSEIIGVDVSQYAGKTLTITATQSVVSGAQYGVFMSDLLLDTELSQLPSFTTINANVPTDSVIEYIQISSTNEVTNTITKQIPTGAKYLYFSNLRKKQTSEPSVSVEV